MKRAAVVVFLCAVLGAAFPRAAGVQQSSSRSDASRRPIADTDLLAFTWVADPQISPDGSTIAFVRVVVNEGENRYETAIDIVPASGAEAPRALTAGIRDTAPRWSPDGKRLAFVRSVERDGRPQAGQMYLLQMTGGEARALTDLPRGVGAPVWSPDGRTIAFTSSLAPPATVTHFNDSLLGRLNLTLPEEISYASFDGKRIQGWILKPPDFDARRRYPMILQIHGGPHSAYGNTFTHEFAWMAAKGYVVLFTNPRGSSSYGQDFGNIIQYRYPGDDYKDLMAGVDEVLERGYVDPERLGVTGGSGGGLLTNWTITQTERFKAAVSQRDIADWSGFWYSADFNLFQPFWFRKAPWEDPQDFAARSPITHVANVTTPLMLVLGDQDYRTPPGDGGEQMFRALKYRRIPTVMVRFPRENHELSRSGEPWHRIERLRHIVGWMDRWLDPSSGK